MSANYLDFLQTKQITDQKSGFKISESKLNPMLFDWQKAIMKWSIARGRAALFEDCGLGKGQPIGAKILTPKGWVKNSDLKVGDKAISSDGKGYKVTGIYFKSKRKTHRIHFSDKSSFVVDEDHLHITRTNNDRQRKRKWKVLSTKNLLECPNLKYGKDKKSRNYDIPIVNPICFKYKISNSLITPYVLGCLLGDGCLEKHGIGISSGDTELINRFSQELPKGVSLKKKNKYDYRIITGLTGNKRHPFRKEIFDLGLLNKKSYEKQIPISFLLNKEPKDRLELLRGLMDTDGYIMDCGTSQFYSTSKKLAEDVRFLVRSLGGVPTFSQTKAFLNGKRYRDCYTVTFSLKKMNPFSLSRKAKKWNSFPRDNGRWIDRIEYEKKQKTICLSVGSPDNSYVTENFIVTHNTPQQLEWANQICKKEKAPILILAPLAVSEQTVREGEKFKIKVNLCKSQKDVKNGINITNYEKLHKFNPDKFIGIVLDESSILKNFTGATRNEIIDAFKMTKYRLACTATPSPNDYSELGNHAEFLGIMPRSEMLATFFINDTAHTGTWRLKGHVQNNIFWKWMASWAVMITKPSDIGFEDDGFVLPKIKYHQHVIETKSNPSFGFFPEIAQTLNDRRKVRNETTEIRCNEAAKVINSTNQAWAIWCNLNIESEMLSKIIKGAKEVAGRHSDEIKTERMTNFANGNLKRIVTKPKIAGLGMNWQVCNKAAFVGLSDSWEQFYQAVRRIWRFGQDKEVDIHIFIEEREGAVLKNIQRKDKQAKAMIEAMVEYMSEITRQELGCSKRTMIEYKPLKNMRLPEWL